MKNDISFKEKLEKLKSGSITCLNNVNDFLTKIKQNNDELNIYLELNKDLEKQAKELDKKRENNEKLGAFFGLCFAVKSNINVKGFKASCASNTLKDYKATYDADVIKTIKQEDGLIVGIVNNDEFACGSSGETSAFGKTNNPACLGRVPGGSSSGSGAVVAAKMCDIALGSDTGGSIRNPASHCGVVGVKPSYGRVSRHGLIDLAMSLDQIGPLTNDVWGNAYCLKYLAKFSENDSVTVKQEVDDYTNQEDIKLKIGVINKFRDFVTDKRILELFDKKIEKLKNLGHKIIEIDVEKIDLAIQAYYPIVYTEFYSGTRKFDGIKYGKKIEESVGVEALRRILGGSEISKSEFDGAYYKKALKVKEIIAREFSKAFNQVDVILTPVTPMLPHKFKDVLTPMQMYAYDAFTIPANLAGVCAGVVSIDKIEDLGDKVPVGLQVMADSFNEKIMYRAMFELEKLS